uniref:Uncharacterized protein n=1 Tax=Panagrolaimus davidi TaxID=227884 RepID=A0A914QB59_9BILA
MKSESENLLPSSLSGEPILKKRKYSTKNEDENDELTELKAEMEKMKQLIEGQQKTIYNQAMTITRLESEKASKNVTDESIIEDPNTSENKVELKNGELKQIIEEERRKLDTELVELKSNMGVQKQNEEKDQKIKELEGSVASIKNVISDPGFAEGDKKHSSCDDSGKKIKDLEAQLELKISTETALKKTIADLEEDRKQLTKLLYQTNTDKLKLEILEQKKKIKGLEKMIEMKEEDLKDFESRITEMDAIYKDVNQQNMDLKDKEYKKIIVENEKKIKDMKVEREKCKSENDGLKDTVTELTKLLSNEQKAIIEHETKINEMDKLKVTVDDLNKELFEKRKNAVVQFIENEQLKQKITIFEENEAKLHSKIEELEQNEHETNETITEQQRKIQDLENEANKESQLKFITLKDVFNGSLRGYLKRPNNNVILKVSRISSTNNLIKFHSFTNPEPVNLEELKYFTNTYFQFQIDGELELENISFFTILPRIYSFNLTKLNLNGAIITSEIFDKLISSQTITSFKNVKVKEQNDERLGYDEILKKLPKIEIFEMEEFDSLEVSELCQNLFQLPPLSNLKQFKLKTIDLTFNLGTFMVFIKVSFILCFNLTN